MKTALTCLIFLYLVALHTSIAGMELFAWLMTATAFAYQCKRRDFSIFRANRAVNVWILGFLVAVMLGLIFNPLYRTFWFQFGFMRWCIVLWGGVFAIQEVWSEDFERRLITLWASLVAITGAYAGLQCFTGIDLIRKDVVVFQGDGVWRATAWFSESLSFAYGFGVSLFAQMKPFWEKRSRRAAIAVGILGGLGLVGAISRGAWAAAILTVLAYLWMTERKKWVLPAAAFFFGLGKLLSWYSIGFFHRINDVQNGQDHSASVRMQIWQAYWEMFKDHPLVGVGIEQGDAFLPEYFAKLGISQDFLSHAHNNLLQFLAGTGIPGFICYSAIVLIFMYKAWRLRKVTAWGWSLLLAQVYMQLGGLTECNFIDGEVNHMLVFTWALLLVIEARKRTS